MKENKVLATITEREANDFKEIDYLRIAAKRILVEAEKSKEHLWEEIKKKYKIKKDNLVLIVETREIKEK